jgi:16S rRNA G966 N2-methylase RsmD
MEIQVKKLKDLKPNPLNPRKSSVTQDENLKKSLEKFGVVEPIVFNKRSGYIVGGHFRVRELKKLGYKEVECVIVDLSPDDEKELLIRLNANTGDWDTDLLLQDWDADKLADWGVDWQNNNTITGSSGNDWNYNYKNLEQNSDGLEEKLGFSPHSMWYQYPRIVEGISEHMIALPTRNNSNPHQDKYSRTSVEEIRRIVLTYMENGDYFLENCCGWSTFGAIAKIHGYSGIGVDIWDTALQYSRKQIELINNNAIVDIIEADGMNLPFENDKFDYVYCNPPFMDVEIYSAKDNDITGKNESEFISNFNKLMHENYRVLKKNKLCTITISDTRKNGVIKSLLNIVLNSAFKNSFELHDLVIVEVLGVANMYRKKAFNKKRMPKNHEYVITFIKL